MLKKKKTQGQFRKKTEYTDKKVFCLGDRKKHPGSSEGDLCWT